MRFFMLLVPSITLVLGTALRVIGATGNHIGFDPLLLLVGVPFALIAARFFVGRQRALAIAIGLLNVVVVLCAVHFNLLLQYEDWIRRGMPEPPSWAVLGTVR